MKLPHFFSLLPLVLLFCLAAEVQSEDDAAEGGSVLEGMLFEDEDADGLRSDSELGVEGIIVDLLDEDGNFVVRVLTDENGVYRFEGLEPGVNFLRFEFEPDFAVRSEGIEVGEGETVFASIPVLTPEADYSFIRLNLINPANFKGREVSPFQP